MSDLICRKTMIRCQTPGTCSPHGGCSTGVLRETEVRYSVSSQPEPCDLPMIDAGKFIDYVWSLREERDTLRTANQRLEGEVSRLRGVLEKLARDETYTGDVARSALSTNGEVKP